MFRWVRRIVFIAMIRDCLVYIIVAVVCKIVDALRSSRGGRWHETVGIRRDDFSTVSVYVGFGGTCLYLTVGFPFNWYFW